MREGGREGDGEREERREEVREEEREEGGGWREEGGRLYSGWLVASGSTFFIPDTEVGTYAYFLPCTCAQQG